jgi:elongation factor 3
MQKLSVGETADIAASVKSDGAVKSGFADRSLELAALVASKDEKTALAALAAVEALAGIPDAEPYLKACLPAVLNCAVDKKAPVREAAKTAAMAVATQVTPMAMKGLLPSIFGALPVEVKWQTRELALSLITTFNKTCPKQLGNSLPEIVPEVTACMWDTKKQVKVAATAAMTAVCDVIGNKDIEHMTESIVKAITTPKAVPEIMHQMAGVVFVSSVECPCLAMVVPLLLRGLKEKTIATKRQAAVVINNMSKLVDNPVDAAPFLPLLLPALTSNAESISDPEAREVTERAVAQLMRLKALSDKALVTRGDTSKMVETLKEKLPTKEISSSMNVCIDHAAEVATTLMDLKMMEDMQWTKLVATLFLGFFDKKKCDDAIEEVRKVAETLITIPDDDDDDDDAEELCNCTFTLAYGTKILLHNTRMKLKRGKNYGLLGGNDSGKTTLMRAISNNQVEGFPDSNTVRTVFVESDIQGEQSHLSCVDYILYDPKIKALGCTADQVEKVLCTVGFGPDKKAKPAHATSTLSGGWRMKLALARAMLQNADILLLDEPTNHLDVINVAWVKNYLNSLTDVTCIMVSHDSGLLNDCCSYILQIANLKLENFKGNLDDFVKVHPEARSFFSFKESKMSFKFPQPGPIEGVKSKGKALMKMSKCTFTYGINLKENGGNGIPTLYDISIQVSLSSRVACVGENGAGKSTMIKLLVGEIVPQIGDVWKHPNARVAYVAQHAFHHIEEHLTRTPNEYIRWRYANGGEDKESLVKVSLQFTDEEIKRQKTPYEMTFVDEESGKISKVKKLVSELMGGRKQNKSKEYEYEVKYVGSNAETGDYVGAKILSKMGWDKAMKGTDLKIAQLAGLFMRPLSQKVVEQHLEDVGLDKEFGTHYRLGALSGGQKVKVVLAAAMWNQPHILILDEPTNYLDRESLGALAGAIEGFDGGVVIISHNNEFCSQLCPETWVMDAGHLETKGDAEWMANQDTKIAATEQITEFTDASGNVNKIEVEKKALTKKEEKALVKKIKAKIKAGEELDESEEEFAFEKDLL